MPGLNITNENWKSKIPQIIMSYKALEQTASSSGPYLISEIRLQYADMANGGDGGDIYSPRSDNIHTIRLQYYPGLPDQYFIEVCDLMGWPR